MALAGAGLAMLPVASDWATASVTAITKLFVVNPAVANVSALTTALPYAYQTMAYLTWSRSLSTGYALQSSAYYRATVALRGSPILSSVAHARGIQRQIRRRFGTMQSRPLAHADGARFRFFESWEVRRDAKEAFRAALQTPATRDDWTNRRSVGIALHSGPDVLEAVEAEHVDVFPS